LSGLVFDNVASQAQALTEYSGALVLGFPACGAGPSTSQAIAQSSAWLAQNCRPSSRIVVKDLTIRGFATVPVRGCDVDLTLIDAAIDHDDTAGYAPILLGATGKWRADATYFPNGGVTSLRYGRIRVRTKSGTGRKTIDTTYGYSGLFGLPVATTTAAALSTDALFAVDHPERFLCSNGVFLRNPSGNVIPLAISIQSITGNNLNFAAPVGVAVPAGTNLWTQINQQDVTMNVRSFMDGGFEIDGKLVPAFNGQKTIWPQFAAGTYVCTEPVPSEGHWLLEVIGQSSDQANIVTAVYEVHYDVTTNPVSPINTITQVRKIKDNNLMDITAASIAAGVVSLTFTDGLVVTAGQSKDRVIIRWASKSGSILW